MGASYMWRGDERRPAPAEERIAHATPNRPPAVILAAGAGSRLRQSSDDPPKPLTPLLGRTLVERSVRAAHEFGVDDFVVVVGYRKEEIIPHLRRLAAELKVTLRTAVSHNWMLGNGASALASEPYVDGAFFLLMADHVFDLQFLNSLWGRDDGQRACALVVDRNVDEVRDVHEATKVRLSNGRISAIGKGLTQYDAVDTGVFLCRPPLFDALREAAISGEHTVGAAVDLLAQRGQMTWAPAGGLFWQDIDTPEDLDYARAHLSAAGSTRSPALVS